MIEFTLAADSSAPAEDVLAAARDFSRRRIAIWPNVSSRRFEVHASGETFVEATETALQGLFWERSRYEWPQPGSVHQTVLDSNVLRPGSTWEITAVPNGDGCHVQCVFRREFTRSPKGRFGWALNRFASSQVYGFDLRRALAAIEKEREGRATMKSKATMRSKKIAPARATDSARRPAAAGSFALATGATSGGLPVRPLPGGSDIRKVGAEEVAAVSESLARAFYDDPLMRWLFPEDARRMDRLRDGFEFYLARIWLRHDECYTTDRRIGAACWLPPGTWRLSLPRQLVLLPAMVRRFGRDLPRLMRFFAAIEKVHPHDRHMYLPAVGVAPEWQGRGFGAALLRPVLERCDRERLSAYLEASSPRNRALYERHGFETVEELRVAKDAPPVWRMWRSPRAGDESTTGAHDSGS